MVVDRELCGEFSLFFADKCFDRQWRWHILSRQTLCEKHSARERCTPEQGLEKYNL